MNNELDKSLLTGLIKKNELQKTREDLHALVSLFKQVLSDHDEEAVAATLTLLEDSIAQNKHIESDIPDEKLIQALSILFQVMNLVEENSGVQSRRKLENQLGPSGVRGSWGETFDHWISKGVTENQIAELLPTIRIMPDGRAHV